MSVVYIGWWFATYEGEGGWVPMSYLEPWSLQVTEEDVGMLCASLLRILGSCIKVMLSYAGE